MSVGLLLVRHAQASFDHDDYDRLSPLGERQAQMLADHWRDRSESFAWCLTGTLQRQIATAAPLQAGSPGLAMQVDPRLDEYDHRGIFYAARPDLLDPAILAHWKASTTDYAQAFEETWSAALDRWMSGRHDADYRESWIQFRKRCLAAITDALARVPTAGCGLVFTSAGPLASVLQSCWSLPDAGLATAQAALYNTGLTELWRDPLAPGPGRLGQVNAIPHLQDPAWRTRR